MQDGALPAMALCIAFGILLGHGRLRVALGAIVATALVGVAASAAVFPDGWQIGALLGSWALTAFCVADIYLGRRLSLGAMLGLVGFVGLAIGAMTSFAGRPAILATALPCLLVCLPSAWLVRSERSIVLKVLASWLLAVAILAAGLTVAHGASAGADHLD